MDVEAPFRLENYKVQPLPRHDGVEILLAPRRFRPEDVVATHFWIPGSLLGIRVRRSNAHGREKCHLHLMRTCPASKSRSHRGGTRDRTRQVVEDVRENDDTNSE